jgi:hypothetical protein
MGQSQKRRRREGCSSAPRRMPGPKSKQAAVRMMCDEVAALDCPLHVEWWTSMLLGQLWELRVSFEPSWDEVDWALVLGGPLVEDIATHGGRGAKLILSAIERIDPGGLGLLSGELSDRAPEDLLPDWARGIGSATVVQATSVRSGPDEVAMFLESGGAGHEAHTFAAFVDYRLGGIAKHLGLVPPIKSLDYEMFRSGGSAVAPRALDPVDACERLHEAITRTDAIFGPPVGENFAGLRALALARAGSLR